MQAVLRHAWHLRNEYQEIGKRGKFYVTGNIYLQIRGVHGPGDPPDPLSPARNFCLFEPNFFGPNIKRVFFSSPFNKRAGLGP